jgi:hypothetical protein
LLFTDFTVLTKLTVSSLLQQWRLLPYVAAAYAMEIFSMSFFMDFVSLRIGIMMGEKGERQVRTNFKQTNIKEICLNLKSIMCE